MKKIFFLLIMVSLSNLMMAQDYYPFPTHDAVWREYKNHLIGPSNSEYYNFQNFISGDTMISGKTCHKIYKTGTVRVTSYAGDSLYDFENVYVGAIREDSSKRVYLCNVPERVLYDFNLQIGDTLPAMYGTYNNADCIFIVSEIDSVVVAGNFHKRFKITYYIGPQQYVTYFIEGIGASTGLISLFIGSYMGLSQLICFMQDSINAYPYGHECELVYLGVDETTTKQQINIFPNPGSGVISLSGLPDQHVSIQVYNLFGQKVYETYDARRDSKIDLSHLPKGMFLLKVLMNGETIKTEKIVLQ